MARIGRERREVRVEPMPKPKREERPEPKRETRPKRREKVPAQVFHT